MEVADTEGHRLWIKLWGDTIQQAANVVLGDHVTVQNCLVSKYRDSTSVSSTDLTDVKVFINYLPLHLQTIIKEQ
jgi:hypothetical protein